MTKENEIAILDEAITKLGKDSYLGPWLSSVRSEVNAFIKSDICPDAMDVSLAASRDAASKIKTAASEEAERIVQSAHDKAKRMESEASRSIDEQRVYALRALDAAVEAVRKI